MELKFHDNKIVSRNKFVRSLENTTQWIIRPLSPYIVRGRVWHNYPMYRRSLFDRSNEFDGKGQSLRFSACTEAIRLNSYDEGFGYTLDDYANE